MPRRRKRRKTYGHAKKNKRTVEMMRKFFNYTCQYCFTNEADTIDHILPIAKFGDNRLLNIIPACKACNEKKANTVLPQEEIDDLLHRARMCAEYVHEVRIRYRHFSKRRCLKRNGRYDLLEDYRMVTNGPRNNYSR